MAQLSRFQTTGNTSWMGITKSNHLAAIFQNQAQKATNFMVQLLATSRGKSLETYLQQFPIKEFDTDDDYTWDIIASSRRNIPLVEARDSSGTVVTSSSGNIGVNGDFLYLVFGENYFADGNVIVGEKNEIYPFRLLGEGRIEGTNTVYKVELMAGNTKGVPAEELLVGKRFSVEYSPVERDFSRGVGDIRFSSPTAMRNEFSMIRIKHKVPGSMLDKKLGVGLPVIDKAGNKQVMDTWMHNVDFQLEQTFAEEKNNLIVFGRSNRNDNGEYLNFGKSGNVIRQGMGLRQQMEVANTIYYNKFNIKLIENALFELSASKLDVKDRLFILKTGERGAAQFSKAVLNVVSGWTAFQLNIQGLDIIKKTESPLHSTSLSAGFQFTEFRAPNGVTLKVEVDPLYDDPVRNKILHPDGGVAESYRYDILYLGDSEQPNIQLASVKNMPEARSYQWGIRNPYTGQMGNPNMSFDEDAAVMHKIWVGGVFVLDPTRTVSIIPSILQ